MTQQEYERALASYVPNGTVAILTKLIFKHNIHVTVSRERKTKLGDFRTDIRNSRLRVSVNGDLNAYSFLITLVHEIAHALVFKNYKRSVKPHGIEWKQEYQKLMLVFFEKELLPLDIAIPLSYYMQNPKASSSADQQLYLALKAHDNQTESVLYLRDLEEDEQFILSNILFRKGKKRRTRYMCKNLSNGKDYTVNGLAEVLRA